MADAVTGSCLCGKIRYSINIPTPELRYCHCKACQKVSGGAGTVNAPIASSAFKITQGTPKKYSANADSGRLLHRYFCGDCGSPIYSQRDISPEMMTVRAGSFDNPPKQDVTLHIWTGSARPWDKIDPSVKQHPGQPDAPAKK